jgi:hydrogenase nickel incorporation protein HypB
MKKIKVAKNLLGENERYAFENMVLLREKKILCLNMISSPGSGKTTILFRTIEQFKDRARIAVIEGDIQTDIDAQRLRATGIPVIQINTQGACHLSAPQISDALKQLPLSNLDLIFIENVGNLVCPADFNLGEHAKIVVLSVPEGDDKPAKYPSIFAKSKALLVNKIDLLHSGAQIDFDLERVKIDARVLNNDIKILPLSAKTGEGFTQWCDWLLQSMANLRTA